MKFESRPFLVLILIFHFLIFFFFIFAHLFLFFRLLRNLVRMELDSSSVVCARLVKLVRKFVAHESSLLVFPTLAHEPKAIKAHILKSTLHRQYPSTFVTQRQQRPTKPGLLRHTFAKALSISWRCVINVLRY